MKSETERETSVRASYASVEEFLEAYARDLVHGAFFSPGENILYTYMGFRGRPRALFHEATHAVLSNLTGRAARGRGRIPAWLNEAWAEFMEGCMVPGKGGRARLDLGARLVKDDCLQLSDFRIHPDIDFVCHCLHLDICVPPRQFLECIARM